MTDAGEFDEFYAATCRRVIGQVYVLTGDLAAAEDAAAEAFTRAWQRWSTVRRSGSAEAWVRTVATRVAIDSRRKTANRWRAHRRSAHAGSDPPELDPDHVVLVQALRTLPEKHRTALVMYYYADAPVARIARDMGVSEGTVKSWLARGRQALNLTLSPDHDDQPEVRRS